MQRPRILLVPMLTELEWVIRPQLEAWAQVASFDAPGVGEEPRAARLDREAIVKRALAELERAGWESCFIVADSHGTATAVRAASAWTGRVLGIAVGHARLSSRTKGERAPLSKGVWEVMGQLLQNDYGAFARVGIAQMTQGSVADELAGELLERVPRAIAQTAYEHIMCDPEEIGEPLRALRVPLLFAKHEGCLSSTDEGWEDAVSAFPEAQIVAVRQAPAVSPDFAEALRSFCIGAGATRSA